MLAIPSAAVPEFVSVTVSGWLVVFTTSSPKVKEVVDKEAFGDPPPIVPLVPPPQPLNRRDPQSMSEMCFFMMPPTYRQEPQGNGSVEPVQMRMREYTAEKPIVKPKAHV